MDEAGVLGRSLAVFPDATFQSEEDKHAWEYCMCHINVPGVQY